MIGSDLAAVRIDVSEEAFDIFVDDFGGIRPSKIFGHMGFENVDYVFPQHKVLAELKNLETEFSMTDSFRQKLDAANASIEAKFGTSLLSMQSDVVRAALHNYLLLFKPILARILKKANKQIRSTKQNLEDGPYRGVVILANSEFRNIPSDALCVLLNDITKGSLSSIDAIVYTTGHLVDVPSWAVPSIIWVPLYPRKPDMELVNFVDRLGTAWFDTIDQKYGLHEHRIAGVDLTIRGAVPVGSVFSKLSNPS